jgi:membrane protein implicated in regulation of membrane protease activity
MKKLVSAALAGAILAGSSFAALAGEGEGVVASVDEATRTIMLEDGSTWTAGDDVDLTALAAGDAIKVTYEDGTTMVIAVEKL